MLFPTIDFAVFFLVVFTGSWVLRPRLRVWKWFILLSSCVFYLDLFRAKDEQSLLSLTVPLVSGLIALTALGSWVLGESIPKENAETRRPPVLTYGAPFLVYGVVLLVAYWLYQTFPQPRDENWRYLYLLLGMAFTNQTLARSVFASLGAGRSRTSASRWLVRLGIAMNLSVLGFFKYFDWVAGIVATIGPRFEAINLLLPIAISFFTFQAISYVVDVGRGELRPISQLDFCVYLTFFAHLVAGPIVRVGEFTPQLEGKADPRFVPASEAFMLIFRGMVKKVVVSSYLAQLVDPVFDLPGNHSGGQVLIATYAYAIQIYADFSGYTDIAIGVALLLGIRFPQNFDAPYRSLSVQDFWRRWHMTLSRWLRDYLYIPLGGNRKLAMFGKDVGELRTYINLFLTMLLGGLWHGANVTFLVWGAGHGLYLGVERYVKERWALRAKPIGVPLPVVKVLQWVLTFHVVVFLWVFFRAKDFSNAFDVFGQIFVSSGAAFTFTTFSVAIVAALVVAMVASQFVPTRIPTQASVLFGHLPPIVQMVGVAAALVAIDAFGPIGISPFIYFRF